MAVEQCDPREMNEFNSFFIFAHNEMQFDFDAEASEQWWSLENWRFFLISASHIP